MKLEQACLASALLKINDHARLVLWNAKRWAAAIRRAKFSIKLNRPWSESEEEPCLDLRRVSSPDGVWMLFRN
jgi:hypothetical protein